MASPNSPLYPVEISIHALLAESDRLWNRFLTVFQDFYPRSPCGERPVVAGNGEYNARISIHALLAESDAAYNTQRKWNTYFYPRSPCGERPIPDGASVRLRIFLSTLSLRRATAKLRRGMKMMTVFLSTLSLRRATVLGNSMCQQQFYFYPRSPCGERPLSACP